MSDTTSKAVPDAKVIRNEDRVDLGILGKGSQPTVIVEIEEVSSGSTRVAPRDPIVALWVKEKRRQDHLST